MSNLSRNCTCVPPDSVLHCLDQNTCRCNTTGMPNLSRNCTCVPPDIVLHCLDQNTCRCNTTGMPNLSRNCTCVPPDSVLRCLDQNTCRCHTTGMPTLSRNCISSQYSALSGPKHLSLQHEGHANLVQELHLQTSRQCSALSGPKHQCSINTGMSKPGPRTASAECPQGTGHLSVHNDEQTCPGTATAKSPNSIHTVWAITRRCTTGHDNILVQKKKKTALRTVRRKPGTCCCTSTGTSTSSIV